MWFTESGTNKVGKLVIAMPTPTPSPSPTPSPTPTPPPASESFAAGFNVVVWKGPMESSTATIQGYLTAHVAGTSWTTAYELVASGTSVAWEYVFPGGTSHTMTGVFPGDVLLVNVAGPGTLA